MAEPRFPHPQHIVSIIRVLTRPWTAVSNLHGPYVLLVLVGLLLAMLAGALVPLGGGLPIIGLVLGAIVVLVTMDRNLEIPLLILTIPLRGFALLVLSLGGVLAAYIRLSDPILVAIGIVWLARKLERKPAPKYSPLDRAVIAFVAMHALSVLWAHDLAPAILRAFTLGRNLLLFLVIRDWLICDFDSRIKQLAVSVAVTAWMLGIGFMYAIEQQGGLSALRQLAMATQPLTSGSRSLWVVRVNVGAGVFFEGVELWYFMGMGVIAGVWPRFHGSSKLFTRLCVPLTITMMFALVLIVLRRTTLIGLAGFVLAVLILLRKPLQRRSYTVLIVASGLAVLALVQTGFANAVWMRVSPQTLRADQALSFRFWLWNMAWESFQQSFPLLGTATGNALPGIWSYTMVHNLYLQILVETGVVGFGIFLVMILAWVAGLWRVFRDGVDRSASILASLLLASVFAYLVASFAGTDFETPDPWILLAVTSALLMKHQQGVGKIAVKPVRARRGTPICASGGQS